MKKIIFSILFVATSVLMFAQKNNGVVTQVKAAETTTIKDNGHNPNTNQNTVEKQESEIILKLENNGNGTKVLYDANADNKKENSNQTTTEGGSKAPIIYKSTNNVTVEKSIDEQIADLENYIQAVDSKIEWVKNNPIENQKAVESGWFEQMAVSKKAAQKKKQELINSKN